MRHSGDRLFHLWREPSNWRWKRWEPAAFDAEFETGQHLSREVALRLALGEAAPLDASGSESLAASPLAKRELEVARLVAEGLSNRQIGVRLFISEATVASHIRHIMDKLGVNSRSQIAVLMALAAPDNPSPWLHPSIRSAAGGPD